MNARLVAECNQRARAEDFLIHVGDFMCRGCEKGAEGLRLPWTHYAGQLHARVVLLAGNHDRQNKVKTVGKHLFGTIGPCRFFASHYPTDSEEHDPLLMDYVRATCHFAICGHVHEKWRVRTCAGIINVNVGVDANGYMPISDDEVLALYFKEKRRMSNG